MPSGEATPLPHADARKAVGGATPERLRQGAGTRASRRMALIGCCRDWAGSPGGPPEGRCLLLGLPEREGAGALSSACGRVGLLRPRLCRKRHSLTYWSIGPRRGSPLPPDPLRLPSAPSFEGRSPQPGRGGAAGAPGPGRSAISRLRHGAHRAVPHRGGPD